MKEYEIIPIITELLYVLYDEGFLNQRIVDSLSKIFDIDAESICESNGITYNINSK